MHVYRRMCCMLGVSAYLCCCLCAYAVGVCINWSPRVQYLFVIVLDLFGEKTFYKNEWRCWRTIPFTPGQFDTGGIKSKTTHVQPYASVWIVFLDVCCEVSSGVGACECCSKIQALKFFLEVKNFFWGAHTARISLGRSVVCTPYFQCKNMLKFYILYFLYLRLCKKCENPTSWVVCL